MNVDDQRLLQQFIATQDGHAFEALMKRHGSLVMGVCKRVLNHTQDAEDAFQASFLVLARKAASLSNLPSLGAWMYGVALRTSLKLRNKKILEGQRFVGDDDPDSKDGKPDARNDEQWNEVRMVLDEELEKLSEKYRVPVVLCYLEGKSYGEAAVELGVTHAAVRSRLMRGRDYLQERLRKRGVVLSAAALSTLITHNASAAVPAALTSSTLEAALQFASEGGSAASLVSPKIVAMATETMTKVAFVKARAWIIGSLVVVGGLVGWFFHASNPEPVNQSMVVEAPEQMIERVFQGLQGVRKVDSVQAMARLQFLRDFNELGAEAIHKFLNSQRDMATTPQNEGAVIRGRYISSYPTFRAILLEVLHDMDGAEAMNTDLDILHNSASGREIYLAARNLERRSPGTHRVVILQAASNFLGKLMEEKEIDVEQSRMVIAMLSLIGYYQGSEYFERVEELLNKDPAFAPFWTWDLRGLPADKQLESLSRIVQNPEICKILLENPGNLILLDYQNEWIRQFMSGFIMPRLLPQNQRKFVGALASMGSWIGVGSEDSWDFFRRFESDPSNQVAGRLKLLDEIEPSSDDLVFKDTVRNTRRALMEFQKRYQAGMFAGNSVPAAGPEIMALRSVASTPRDVLKRLLFEFESKRKMDTRYALGCIQQLVDAGDNGIVPIHEFLQTMQDVVMEEPVRSPTVGDGNMKEAPRNASIRPILIESLFLNPSLSSRYISLDVLGHSSSKIEIYLAAKNLEKKWPGAHRAEIQAAFKQGFPNSNPTRVYEGLLNEVARTPAKPTLGDSEIIRQWLFSDADVTWGVKAKD